MTKTNGPVLLIATNQWVVETIQAIMGGPSLISAKLPDSSLNLCPSTEEALAKYNQTRFRLILLEYRPGLLPDIKALRANFSKTPIILIAEAGQEADIMELIAVPQGGAQDYLLWEELNASAMRRLLRPAHLYAEARDRLQEMRVLSEIATIGSEAKDVSVLLTEVTRIIANSLYHHHVGFIMRGKDGRWRPHAAYHSQRPLQLPPVLDEERGIVGWVIRNGRSRCVADVRTETDYLPLVPSTRSELCVPLQLRGETIGVINIESINPDEFSESDERLLLTLARQLATVIEKINLLKAERRRRQEAETLRDIMASLASTLDTQLLLQEILVQLSKVVPHDTACVILLQGDCLQILAARGFAKSDDLLGQCFPSNDPFFNQVRQTKQPIYLPDVNKQPDFRRWGDAGHIRGWICAPLIVHDEVLGVLTVDNKQVNPYSDDDVTLTQVFANQAALAIKNARLYEAEQAERQTAEILRVANESLTKTLDREAVLQTLTTYLVQIVPVDSMSVLLLDNSGDYVRLHSAWGFERWTDLTAVESISISIHTNQTLNPIFTKGQHVLIEDTAVDPRWESFPETHYVRSWLGMPILVGEKVIGAFSLDKATPHFFTAEHVRLARTITAQAAIALQNAQLFAETEQRAAELATITEISASLRQAESLDEMMAIILEYATAVTSANFSSIYLVEPESGDLILRLSYPLEPALIGHRHRLGEGITGHVALSGEPYICPDVQQSPYYKPISFTTPLLRNLRATISLPLRTKNRVLGVMHHSIAESLEFGRAEINLLTAISEIGASALERAMLLETLEQRVAQRTSQLADAYERLQELDRLKSKFVSDVSHELRTPITNLSLYVDLLNQGRPDRQAHYQSILRQQVDRLNTLIEDTLHISRLDMGKIQMTLLPLQLNSLVTECVAEFHSLVNQRGNLQLTAVLQPDLPPILGDENQLRMVIHNLLRNAIYYTSEGSIVVATRAEPAARRVCLRVTDSGMGIAEADLPHLFERFYRGTAVSQSTIPGTGLGLAIAKEIVDRHQGTIQVENQTGSGATFTVCLPVAEWWTVDGEQ